MSGFKLPDIIETYTENPVRSNKLPGTRDEVLPRRGTRETYDDMPERKFSEVPSYLDDSFVNYDPEGYYGADDVPSDAEITSEFGPQVTFENTEKFMGMTENPNRNMFGGCINPTEIYIPKLNKCVSMYTSEARQAMIRMLRKPVSADDIRMPRQTSGTCWFFAALSALFLSDRARVNSIPLRETMILGRKGYRRDAEKVPPGYRYQLLILNQTIQLLTMKSVRPEDENAIVAFDEILAHQDALRSTEAHVTGLGDIDSEGDRTKIGIDWNFVLDFAICNNKLFRRGRGPFQTSNPLAFFKGIAALTSQINDEDFMSITEHDQSLSTVSSNCKIIVRCGLGLKKAQTELTIDGRRYVLDAMILYSNPVEWSRTRDRHATALIHIGGDRYWLDSNDVDGKPPKYDWYNLFNDSGVISENVNRPSGPEKLPTVYNIRRNFNVLVYQYVKPDPVEPIWRRGLRKVVRKIIPGSVS